MQDHSFYVEKTYIEQEKSDLGYFILRWKHVRGS